MSVLRPQYSIVKDDSHTLLLNQHTGQTWQLYLNRWQPVPRS